ncbi:MAG TPA: hypothetical protein VFH44_09790 [Solirubrobacterales bacterium]|nr:hypothetical protein [Solirubrobacterales bacterium]
MKFAAHRCLGSRAGLPVRDERGIALPVVLMVVIVGFALASIGALAAIGSIRNAGRDESDKSALAVAEAAAQQALFRQNNVLTTDSFPCLVKAASGDELVASSPQADNWCATQSGTVGEGTYRYRVLPDAGGDDPSQKTIAIVAEGTLNGETRRIHVGAAAATGTPAFAGGNVVGLDQLHFHGTPDVIGTMRTNGDVIVEGSATCNGDATVGNGHHIVPSDEICNGEVTQGTTTLGPVDPGNVWGTNDNARLTNGEDVIQSNRTVWNATTRTLTLKNKDTVTLGGGNYALCKLDMTGGNLIAALGTEVRIYFGGPEMCGGETAPIAVTGGRVTATSGNPDDMALLVVGSETVATTVTMRGNGVVNDLVIYAPRSAVAIGGTADYNGAIAGKSLELHGTGTITGWDSTLTFTTAVESLYKQTRFVECIGPLTLSDPDNGC